MIIVSNSIPFEIISDLDWIINNQEGGWKLISIPGDNDGGWTYAGVTHKNFAETAYARFTYQEMEKLISTETGTAILRTIVYHIYKQNTIIPSEIIELKLSPELQLQYLSCAINCGPRTAYDMLKSIPNVETAEIDETAFFKAWIKYYIKLCEENPEKLKFLAGWINRVLETLP